jgi:hypothetical protein
VRANVCFGAATAVAFEAEAVAASRGRLAYGFNLCFYMSQCGLKSGAAACI